MDFLNIFKDNKEIDGPQITILDEGLLDDLSDWEDLVIRIANYDLQNKKHKISKKKLDKIKNTIMIILSKINLNNNVLLNYTIMIKQLVILK